MQRTEIELPEVRTVEIERGSCGGDMRSWTAFEMQPYISS